MGGGSSTPPPPQIIYRTDPAALEAMKAATKAAQDSARRAAEQNAALQNRLNTLETRSAQNQREMTKAMQEMATAAKKNNSAELARLEQQHKQQIEVGNRKRQEMEQKFRQQMEATAEENRAALAREQEEHRAEQARLEEEGRRARLAELAKQQELITSSLEAVDEEMLSTQQSLEEEELKLDSIKTFLVIEMKARAQFEHIEMEGNVHKMIMLGKTGDGKSTLGNRLTGDTSKRGDRGQFATSAGLESATQVIKTAFTRCGGEQFCVADTPGSDDTEGKDRIHATSLVDFLHGVGAVNAFVLVRNVTNKRLSKSEQQILEYMEELLGKAFWENVMIVFTRVDDEEAEEDLQEDDRGLPNRIGEIFGLSPQIVQQMQVVGIGKRNYERQSQAIFEAVVQCNDGRAFVCEDLVAPVEQRQAEFDEQQHVVDNLRMRLQELATRKGHLQSSDSQVNQFVQDLLAA